jgi:quinoprotein glucose dehydrogenase
MRICTIVLLLPAAFAQTVLDGAYTAAQAMRGEAAYQMHCGGCHGETLDGRAMGALRGDKFLDRWREESLTPLFDHIRTRMPANAAGSLSSSAYLDILAYILQVNTYPPGPRELTADSAGKFKLVGKGGPKPLGSNTLVTVIGCFTGASGEWTVDKATEPVRTRNADEITAEERSRATTLPLGSQGFQLENLDELPPGFKPEALQGHKVAAKGVLLRRQGKDRINVLAIESVGSDCK